MNKLLTLILMTDFIMATHQGRETIHISLGLVANSFSAPFLNLGGLAATLDHVGFNAVAAH